MERAANQIDSGFPERDVDRRTPRDDAAAVAFLELSARRAHPETRACGELRRRSLDLLDDVERVVVDRGNVLDREFRAWREPEGLREPLLRVSAECRFPEWILDRSEALRRKFFADGSASLVVHPRVRTIRIRCGHPEIGHT